VGIGTMAKGDRAFVAAQGPVTLAPDGAFIYQVEGEYQLP
jgi:hypothetical protein